MINLFNKLYSIFFNNVFIFNKLKFNSLGRYIVRYMSNFVLPIYFQLTKNNSGYSLKYQGDNSNGNKKLIVSLTTFPKRISKINLVLECLLRQSIKPDAIILWLSKEQFSSKENLPGKLIELKERGIQICFVDGDIKSHKKYYYAFKQFPNDIIVTVDDDVYYKTSFLKDIINLNKLFPQCICANHAKRILRSDHSLRPYKEWSYKVESLNPNKDLVQIGIGGVLYPPHLLHKDVLDMELSQKLTPLADDIWLYAMARLAHVNIVKSSAKAVFLPVLNNSDQTLTSQNVSEGLNDKQICHLRNHYQSQHNVDLFQN